MGLYISDGTIHRHGVCTCDSKQTQGTHKQTDVPLVEAEALGKDGEGGALDGFAEARDGREDLLRQVPLHVHLLLWRV